MQKNKNNIDEAKIKELVERLRSTVSVSKRKMLDEAADTIEMLYSLVEDSQKSNN